MRKNLKNIKTIFDKWIVQALMSKWFYLMLTFIFIAISVTLFLFKRPLDRNNAIDAAIFGTFGDFIGGVLGTLLTMISVLLVVQTFKHQQKVTEMSNRQVETQRFNDMFFELLHLYKEQVAQLDGSIELSSKEKEESGENKESSKRLEYNNKDFFDIEKTLLQTAFQPGHSFDKNLQSSLNLYMKFYTKNAHKMAAYFRTIYRIYDLIDTFKLNEEQKRNYSKIIRAQFTQSELFFLRYNATSYYGHKFIPYLNKYHVLKHLPFFELLEFKDWWKDISLEQRTGMNVLLSRLYETIEDSLDNNIAEETPIMPASSKYNLKLINKENGTEIMLFLSIDTKGKAEYAEYSPFDSLEPKRIQQLFDCVIKEIFLYSNFTRYNKEWEQKSDPIQTDGDVITINSGIRSTNGQKLKLRYNFNENNDAHS